MNKHDFYKELMTEYALDPEKIRMNALKQAKKPAWQKAVSTYWKPALGTAAAAAVAIGATTFANQPSVPDVIVAPEEALSASQRLIEAERSYYNATDEELQTDIYVTFMEPVSYTEIIMALSAVDDSGDIELCSIYLEDDVIRTGEIDDYAAEHPDDDSAVAAKISLPVSYYRDIQDLSIVYLAELGSADINDETFVPISVEDNDPLENDHLSIVPAVTTTPVVTTTPFSFDAIPEETEEEIPVIGESGDENTTLPPVTSGEESAPTEITEETTVVTTTVPETTPEETTTTYYRGDVGLLTEIYELNVENALDTYIVGNNVVVLSKEKAYIYTVGGFSGTPHGSAVDIINPKLAYKDDSRIILTGCNSDNTRNILITINTETDAYLVYDASANIGGSEIASVSYCEQVDKFYLKAVSASSTLVYELHVLSDTELSFRPLVEVEAPLSIAGSNGDILYYTTSAGGDRTALYSFNCLDGTLLEYASFSSSVKIKRSVDFRSFAVIVEDSSDFIFDVETNRLVPVEIVDSIQIISEDGVTYFATEDAVNKIGASGEISDAGKSISFSKETRQEFVINEITSEKVVIIRDDGQIW